MSLFLLSQVLLAKAYVIDKNSFIHDFEGDMLNTDDFTWSTEPDYLPITLTQDDSLVIENAGTKWEKISLIFTGSIDISENPQVKIIARSTVDNTYKLQLLDTEGGSTYSQFTVDFTGDTMYHEYSIDVGKSWANLQKINQIKFLYGDQETNRGQIVIKKISIGGAAQPIDLNTSPSLPTDRSRVIVGKKTSYGYTVLTSDSNLLRGNAIWLWRAKFLNNPSQLEYAFQEEYYKALADSGVNFIRLCIYTQSNDWDGGTNYNDQEEVDFLLKYTDSVVNFASKYNMYVLLNYHDVGKYTGEYGDKDAPSMGYLKDFWDVFAPYYKDRTHVFYEPANEPAFGSSNFEGALLDSMYLIYDFIQQRAPETHQSLLCITGAVGKSWDSQTMEDAVNRFTKSYQDSVDWTNASFAFHPYTSTEMVYSSDPIINVMEDYAVINTESNYPCDPEIHDIVRDADKQCQTVDGETFITQTMERLGISWNQHKSRGWDHFNNNFPLVIQDAREKGYIWFGKYTEYTVQSTAKNGYITPRGTPLRFEENASIRFEAIPDEGYKFSGWKGDTVSQANPIDFRPESKIIRLTANFSKIKTYTITLTDTLNGHVSLSPNKAEYFEGDSVRAIAYSDDGYQFTGWKQEFLQDTNIVYIHMNADVTLSPVFEKVTRVNDVTGVNSLCVRPNPFTNEVTIQLGQNFHRQADVHIFSLSGKLVYKNTMTSSQLKIKRNNINGGKPGVYLLKVKDNNTLFNTKLIIE